MNVNRFIDVEFQVQLAMAYMQSLLRQTVKLWGFLVFVLAIVFGALKGFGPLLFVVAENPDTVRTLTIISGFYACWTFLYTGFLQKQDRHTVQSHDAVETVEGNKSVLSYGFGVVVWLAFFIAEQIIGEPHTAFLAICAFIQLLPLFMGDSFKEQSENLMPFLANVIILVTAAYTLAIGG